MKYIFFDIEAIDEIRNICEFGYTIWNPSNKQIYKWNYLINPKSKFKLVESKWSRDLYLSFAQEKYKDAFLFKDLYKNIKSLLNKRM